MTAKAVLAQCLAPIAWPSVHLGRRIARLWAFARLSASLQERPDASIVIEGAPEIHGTGRVALGKTLYLYRELYLETRGAGRIAIGDGCVLSRGVHIVAYHAVSIGAGSMIGEYASIRDANHRFGEGVAPRDSGHAAQAVVIGRHVWIGRGVAVLPGVTIGDGAVVGANAVVTRDVPAGAVVAGVPALPLARRTAPGETASC